MKPIPFALKLYIVVVAVLILAAIAKCSGLLPHRLLGEWWH